jgi:DNA-binding transcriptional LysR family regulator
MDAADLRVFEAVARLGGMNRAAGELNTVQSNVTARIRALEEELGAALFRRHSRGVALTDAGRRLLPYAMRILRLFDEAERAVEDDGAPKGPLTIGSLETTAAQRLSPVIAAFGTRYPSVNLVLKTGTNASLVDAVLRFQMEGAFVCGPVNHFDLTHEAIFTEELVLATAARFKHFEDVIGNGDFKILVKGPGCSYRQRLEDLLARRGIIGFSRLEFGTLEAIIGCVSAGLGVTLLPRSVLESASRSNRVALHSLPAAETRVETLFIQRRDVPASSALRAFLAVALREGIATAAAE